WGLRPARLTQEGSSQSWTRFSPTLSGPRERCDFARYGDRPRSSSREHDWCRCPGRRLGGSCAPGALTSAFCPFNLVSCASRAFARNLQSERRNGFMAYCFALIVYLLPLSLSVAAQPQNGAPQGQDSRSTGEASAKRIQSVAD